ncbi:esterase FE4-like [Anoplophora glabripennis]|uniref:esterase FE4-like n=1 Tax=Anoplophora glabripennis TaxID=217634 RepID=UPI000C76B1F5|nr:esterase FE4-like [Anoplophora glabripennis]
MDDPVVTVREGKVRGKISTDFDGNHFYSFQGIPYAKPPLGDLRFKAPEPPEKWNGILDATENGNECYAKSNIYTGSEDCLFINVFTKKIQAKFLKPVMFLIHGGGFISGSSHSIMFGPEYLITQDVVLVTFNYRLGVLGFLCLDDSTLGVPGNAGLKDMVMALNWVQYNIKNFSGDPNNVTIFGQSSGGASVHLLMLSPMAKGLFHKAIAQSGCALNVWARGKKHTVHLLADILGIDSTSDKVILEQLQKISVKELYNSSNKLADPFYVGKVRPFGPIVEKKSAKSFLSEEPIDLIKSGRYHKVPLIMGYCSREGIFVYAMCTKGTLLNDETIVPYSVNLRIGSDQYNSTVNSIKKFYFNDRNPLENKDDIYRLYTDNFFLLDMYNSARYLSETGNSPIYFYKFSLDTTLNSMKRFYSVTEPGACHSDELSYLFKNGLTPEDIEPKSPEYVGIKRMIKLWTNFVKYGNPTPNEQNNLLSTSWKPLESSRFNYLDIGEELVMKTDPEKKAMYFWNNLYNETSVAKAKL